MHSEPPHIDILEQRPAPKYLVTDSLAFVVALIISVIISTAVRHVVIRPRPEPTKFRIVLTMPSPNVEVVISTVSEETANGTYTAITITEIISVPGGNMHMVGRDYKIKGDELADELDELRDELRELQHELDELDDGDELANGVIELADTAEVLEDEWDGYVEKEDAGLLRC
jgi:hypothetical protein